MDEIKYPRVDRSKQKHVFEKKDDGDSIDLRCGEGVFSDGRPFLVETWGWGGCSYESFYFSSVGIEDYSPADLKGYLVREKIVEFLDDKYMAGGFSGKPQEVRGIRMTDDAGNPIWEVTVLGGDEDGGYIRVYGKFKRYPNQPG